MAQKAAVADGNWSTAGTWNSVTNTPTLHASTNITLNSAVGIFTATFTAPNLVNGCVGVLFYVTTVPVGATYVVTLQEGGVDTATTASIAAADFPIVNNWIFFKFAAPYVFTTVVAGSYRFKITRAAATTNAAVAADSGGANPAFLAVDDRTGVPAGTDDVWLVGANGTGTVSVTMDGTQTIGSGTNTTGISQRSIGNAVTISDGGLLLWNTAASADLTSMGNVTVSGSGELRMGTVATPYPTGQTAQLIFNENGTTTQYGLETYVGGKLTTQGEPKTSTSLWKTTYTSGVGTAADPFIVADAVDWAVNDEILVCAYSANATNYNETENKFIKTKNSATSYVLSDTAGGAESALAFTHTAGAYVLNVQRNVIIKSSTTTEGFYLYNANTTAGDVNIDWVRFETMGSTTQNKSGVGIIVGVGSISTCDYSIAYRPLHTGFFIASSSIPVTFTGLIGCNQNSSTTTGAIRASASAHNKTLIDCFAVKNNRIGIYIFSSSNIRMTRCVGISNNTVGSAVSVETGGISLVTTNAVVMTSCEVHCNRIMGLTLRGVAASSATSFLAGTKGTNAIDVNQHTDFYSDIVFINSSFGSATFVSNYLNMLAGSQIAFQTLNGTANNHVWYTNTGIARSTGAGLTDTTTKTAGNLAVRLAPEDATTGFVWEFLVGIKANSAASIFGFAQKNVAFGVSVCTIELFLPGSTTADATATLDNTTAAWQVFNLAANYTGSVAAFATVRITALTTTAAAYVYFTDFYNGTNVLTGLQAWYQGKPTPVMTDLLGDPASVWAILTTTLTTAGTIGKLLVDNIDASIADVEADTQNIQTRLPAALTGGRMDSSVGAMAANVLTAAAIATDAIDADALAADAIAEIQAGLSTLTAAQVNAEVVDALTIDTYGEPAAVPAATSSLKDKIGWLFTLARNKITQTAATQTLRNDADGGNIGTTPVSDDGVTATRGKWS